MATSTSFTWPNRDKTLIAAGATRYAWVTDRGTPTSAQVVEQYGRGAPSGVVACGDALDVVDSLHHDGRLMPGDIKVVYIDPPFGAGKRFGHYNDVLAEAAWLSMMKDRLEAILPFLGPDSSVWVHLDETMSHKARLILDDIFGPTSYVSTIAWQKRLTMESRTAISSAHDPILVYALNGPKHWKTKRNRISGNAITSNRDGDARGPWRDAPFTAPGYRSGQQYKIVNPSGMELSPPRGRSWFATEPVFRRLLDEDRIWWTKNGAGQPRMKNFDVDALQVPGSVWSGRDVGTNDDGKRHMASLFPDSAALFDTPKPETLIARILEIASNPGDLVVDLFAGSGSTAAAAHKMGRHWIAAERMPTTVKNIILPRLKAVLSGNDSGGITESVKWSQGGSFDTLVVPPRKDPNSFMRQFNSSGRAGLVPDRRLAVSS